MARRVSDAYLSDCHAQRKPARNCRRIHRLPSGATITQNSFDPDHSWLRVAWEFPHYARILKLEWIDNTNYDYRACLIAGERFGRE
jgi:hypothetical protein